MLIKKITLLYRNPFITLPVINNLLINIISRILAPPASTNYRILFKGINIRNLYYLYFNPTFKKLTPVYIIIYSLSVIIPSVIVPYRLRPILRIII
jgi:hypothetical protein